MQIETGELQLSLWRSLHELKHAVKVKATKGHPASSVTEFHWTMLSKKLKTVSNLQRLSRSLTVKISIDNSWFSFTAIVPNTTAVAAEITLLTQGYRPTVIISPGPGCIMICVEVSPG